MHKLATLVLALATVSSAQFWNPNYNTWNGWNWNQLNNWNNWATRALPAVYSTPSVAVPAAAPSVAAVPAPWAAYAPAFSASQYHAQDELGQASFGYSHPGQAAANYRDAFGNQAGSWSYIDAEGKNVVVNYVADANGFRVVSNNLPQAPSADLALPQPVVDTPEVAEAKAAHMKALKEAEAGTFIPVNILPMPQPVEDTPEVAAAKAEHAKAWTEAKALAESSGERKKRQVFAYSAPLPYAAAFHAPLSFVPKTTFAYTVPAATPVREATLTKTILNPNHAVAYRVD